MTTMPLTIERPAHVAANGERFSAAAALLRALAEAMLASVQRTTEMNWNAARLLLARSYASNWREYSENSATTWRWSWRSYQVCATTAAQVLELCREHAESTNEDMWRTLRQTSAQVPGLNGQQGQQLQSSLRAVESAFSAYLGAVGSLQRQLAALAQGDDQ